MCTIQGIHLPSSLLTIHCGSQYVVVEDYFNLVSDTMLACPREFLHSNLFPTVFNAMLASFSLNEQYSLASVFRFCRIVLDHMNDLQMPPHPPSRSPSSTASSSSSSPSSRLSINDVTIVKAQFVEHGAVFMTQLIHGLIYNFPFEVQGEATGIIKATTLFCPQESVLWYGKAVSALENMSPSDVQKAVDGFSS